MPLAITCHSRDALSGIARRQARQISSVADQAGINRAAPHCWTKASAVIGLAKW
jgi:hypothetical protein